MSHKIIFITGQKGTGKTYLAQKLAQGLHAAGRRLFVLSPQSDIRIPGVWVTSNALMFGKLAGRSVICYPEADAVADKLFRFVWHLQDDPKRSPVWLFVDELPMYLDGRRPFDSLLRLVRYGRNRRISIVGTAQRVAQVHNDFLSNADIKIIFRVQEVNDLVYLKRYIGSIVDRLPALADRKFLTVGL